MWRTFALLTALGFLLVSVGGNAVLFQQAAANRADAESLRGRVRTLLEERNSLEARTSQLSAENDSLKARAPAPNAPAPSITPGATPASAGPDRSILQRIEDQVSRLRGLASKQPVPVRFLDRTQLRQYFIRSFEEDYLPSDRESDQKLLVTLGLLNPSDNLVNILLDLLQEQVIGVYSDEEKQMYLINDQAQFGPEAKITYAHEFNHALQDQYFDLGKIAPEQPENADSGLAAQALIEGDSVLLERLWAQENLTPDELQQMANGAGGTSTLDQAPLVVQRELLFPYTDGFSFARTQYQRTNSSTGVDDAFRTLPLSTEQILHPDKYRAGEQPIPVQLPDVAQALGAGWRQIAANTLGELDTRILLEQYGDRTTASRAASGWGGDRWQLLEKDGQQAIAWKTTWDTDNDAREFFDAYAQGLRQRFPGARQEEASAARQALTAAGNATELRRNGRDVLAVISFDRPTADQITATVGGF